MQEIKWSPAKWKCKNIQKRTKKHLKGIYLKESWEHVERVNSRGTICIWQHLVHMATPSIFLIVIGNRLERCQDSGEEGRRGRRGLNLWEAVCVTFILTETHTGANKLQSDMFYTPLSLYWRTNVNTHTCSSSLAASKQPHIALSLPPSLQILLQYIESPYLLQCSSIITTYELLAF